MIPIRDKSDKSTNIIGQPSLPRGYFTMEESNMSELIPRTKNLCYRGYEPKVSCSMDPSMVQMGDSLAKQLGLKPLPISQLVRADGTPYLGHNGSDTVGRWKEKIYPIPCPKSKVKSVQKNERRGNWLEYGNARVTVWQAHFEEIFVKTGQSLKDDTLIGIEGATGKVSGKHLHTSILIDGKRVDPWYYMTGELQLPDEYPDDYTDAIKASDGFYDWPVTDRFEKSITPKRYEVSTGGPDLRIRKSPGIDKPTVGLINNGKVIQIDKLAALPDKQVWGRLKDLPWHWVCLQRGQTFAEEVKEWPEVLDKGFYVVRDSATETKSQTGAFKLLSNAKRLADKHGQKVIAPDGTVVYES